MKVYTYDPAPNPQRLAIFLKLKGVEIATQQVDIAAAEQLGMTGVVVTADIAAAVSAVDRLGVG